MKAQIKKILKIIWAHFWIRSHLWFIYTKLLHCLTCRNKAIFLMYHRIIPREAMEQVYSLGDIIVYQDVFEKQMAFLKDNYNVISLGAWVKAAKKKTKLPNKTVVITFDDGWEDNYIYAYPIMKKYQLPFTIYLTANVIGTDKIFWQEKVAFLIHNLMGVPDGLKNFISTISDDLKCFLNKIASQKESLGDLIKKMFHLKQSVRDEIIEKLENYLSHPRFPQEKNMFLNWEQIKMLERDPIVSFGSHAMNHAILTKIDDEKLSCELNSSKKILEDKCNRLFDTFAYPNGNYNENVIKHIKKTDYVAALTTDKGFNTDKVDLYKLKRLNVSLKSGMGAKNRFSKVLFQSYVECLF